MEERREGESLNRAETLELSVGIGHGRRGWGVPIVTELTREIRAGLVGKSQMWGEGAAQECNRQGQLNSDDSSYH